MDEPWQLLSELIKNQYKKNLKDKSKKIIKKIKYFLRSSESYLLQTMGQVVGIGGISRSGPVGLCQLPAV